MSIEDLDIEEERSLLRRREALVALGGLAGGALWAGCSSGGQASASAEATAAASCILTPEVTEGPFWVANHLTRRDITEGRPGLGLLLHLTVLNAKTCKAIKNADVELWHTDARGVYSGVQGNTKHFLRGHQKTDAKGLAIFKTIYPGWYSGRTPHIHLKVHVGGGVVHTGQLFFSDKVSSAVYRTAQYKSRGRQDVANSSDSIYKQAGSSKAQLKLTKRAHNRGYLGAITLGVAT